MTYTIQFSDTTKTPFTIDPFRYDGLGAINGQHTSLTLLGKGYSDYGQELWTNLVHMLENHSDTLPPVVPIEGQLWYDNSSITNLKICKKAPGGGYKWIDIVDTETLQKLLYSSDFFSESILQSNVRVPSGQATIDGNVHIKGKLEVDNGIYSYRAPATGNEVVTLNYLSSRLTSITSKYVPLKLTGATTIDGKAGILTVSGKFAVTDTLTLTKDPTQQTDAANKKYVDTAITNGGVTWPAKTAKSVLVSPNGTDVAFIDITPEYICKTDLAIPVTKTGYNVIASNSTASRAYWINLDDGYVFTQASTVEQEILSAKKFNKLTLLGEVKDSTGSPGAAGDVLKSQGPNLPPIWGAGSSNNNNNQGSNPFANLFEAAPNEDVTILPGVTYQRSYLTLPNNLIAQWIIGYPIQDKNDTNLDNVAKTTDTYVFGTNKNVGQFLYSNTPWQDDIMCRYQWKVPFETILFKSTTTQVVNNTGLTTNHNSNYKWSDFGSTNYRPCVTLQQDFEHLSYDLSPNPPFTKIAPVIFALGTWNSQTPTPEQVTQLVFNTTTTWDVPANATNIHVTLVGGGGAGGTGVNDNDWQYGGGGGGSGGVTRFNLDSSLFGQQVQITIGVGGEPAKHGSEQPGSATFIKQKSSSTALTFTKTVGTSAQGGLNGKTVTAGAGGTPGGIAGEVGAQDKDSNSTAKVRTGNGGDSPLAPGSGGVKGDTNVKQPVMQKSNANYGLPSYGAGGTGQYFGAGGGGGWYNSRFGGAGANGVAIIDITY